MFLWSSLIGQLKRNIQNLSSILLELSRSFIRYVFDSSFRNQLDFRCSIDRENCSALYRSFPLEIVAHQSNFNDRRRLLVFFFSIISLPIVQFQFQMDTRKALFQSPHVSSVESTMPTATPTNNNAMILNTIELENATQFYRSETEKELHSQRLQKIRENIQSLSADAWLYQDPDKLIGFQRVTTH